MALFGQNNQERAQKQMFEQELQAGREENAVKYSDVGDDVYFAQKEKNEDLTKWQMDLRSEIERTIHILRREVEDSEGNYKRMKVFKEHRIIDGKQKRVYKYEKPIMNQLGINMFVGALIPLVSRNLMMSNYSEEKIFVKLRSIMFTFISHLAYYHKTYEIEVGNLSVIVRMFKDIAEPAHWRSLNDGERRHQETIRKMIEAVTYGDSNQQSQQKAGFLKGLMG